MPTSLTTYKIVSSFGDVSSGSRDTTPKAEGGPPPRRRLTAEQARARILDAATRRLAEVGPEGLRLTELASELGISHPAILHHFGNREGLLVAVVRRAFETLNDELLTAIAAGGGDREALLDRVAELYGKRGHARTIAWLVLSGRSPRRPANPEDDAPTPVQRLIDVIHTQRTEVDQGADPADTAFRVQLTAVALLGEAIFGNLVLGESGTRPREERAKEFRRRLAELVWTRSR